MQKLLYKCSSKEEQSKVYQFIDKLGFKIHMRESNIQGEFFKTCPCIGISENTYECCGFFENNTEYKVTTSFSKFIKYLMTLKMPIVVKNLTSEYSGFISEDGIKVGCQLVTWEKYEELEKAVKEFKERG